MVDSIVPLVAEKLRLPVANDVDVRYLEGPLVDDKGAFRARFMSPPPRIELHFGYFANADILTHEIVHHYMTRAGWADSPDALEETIAGFIATVLSGIPEDDVLSKAISTTPLELEKAFGLTVNDIGDLSQEEMDHTYRVGLDFIRKIGWPRMLTMLHEGRFSPSELLAAYGEASAGVEAMAHEPPL